jgi:hypothetical protein
MRRQNGRTANVKCVSGTRFLSRMCSVEARINNWLMQAESGSLCKAMTIYIESHPEVIMVALAINANDWVHVKMFERLLDRLRFFGFVVTNIFPTAHFYKNNEKLSGGCSTVFSRTRLAKI